MPQFTDQTGYSFVLVDKPIRIISTVPSQTELLFDLRLGDLVVGVTAYCVHPKSALKPKAIIGGTKDLKLEKILTLKPDLIIGNKEENVKEQVEFLRKHVPVWLSDIESVDDALNMVTAIGSLTKAKSKADLLVQNIEAQRKELQKLALKKRVAYFIWKGPMMMAGPHTFIGKMLEECGFENVAPGNEQRYPQIPFDKISSLQPDLIILSSEPYAFTAEDAHDMARVAPNAIIKVLDGELFSWYGSRMLKSFKYFEKLLHNL